MRYFFDDGGRYIELRVETIDDDGDTILVCLNEVVVPADEYVYAVYNEMGATGEDLAQCVDRVREYYRNVRYRGQTVVFETASDAIIRAHFLDNYDRYREENSRPELTVEYVRWAL